MKNINNLLIYNIFNFFNYNINNLLNFVIFVLIFIFFYYLIDKKQFKLFYFGDWGLGIGDWAQSPIPNPHPQSPIPTFK